MYSRLPLGLACALVTLAAVVLCEGPARAAGAVSDALRESDSNGDGKLQRSEAPIDILTRFSQIDQDGDGAIDSYEAWDYDMRSAGALDGPPAPQAARPPPTPAAAAPKPGPPRSLVDLVRAYDHDGDGRVAIADLPAPLRPSLMDADPDGDGLLDMDEARVLDERRSREQSASAPSAGALERAVRLMDTNGDGRLQKSEAPLSLQRVFEDLDTNGDGAIDAAEAARADAAQAARAKAKATTKTAERVVDP